MCARARVCVCVCVCCCKTIVWRVNWGAGKNNHRASSQIPSRCLVGYNDTSASGALRSGWSSSVLSSQDGGISRPWPWLRWLLIPCARAFSTRLRNLSNFKQAGCRSIHCKGVRGVALACNHRGCSKDVTRWVLADGDVRVPANTTTNHSPKPMQQSP